MARFEINRRDFLQTTAAATGVLLAAGADSARAQDAFTPFAKAIQFGHLPEAMSDAEKFAFAGRLGFEGVEMGPMPDLDAAARRGEDAEKAGVRIHSIIYGGWGAPMSDPNPRVIEKGKAEIENALRTAKAVGADNILLVPGVVTDRVRYGEAWERSHANIQTLLPLAQELGIVIAVENVWNKFLLSPLEFAAYVDSFDSPWLRAYFDLANAVLNGYPEDWIRTLGARIVKVHVKDFKRKGYEWSGLPYEGDVNWLEVRRALAEVGYDGWITEEFPGGDEDYLRELSRRMTLFGEGAAGA